MTSAIESPNAFYAQTYDASVSDWPGEIAFYLQYAAEASSLRLPVLELACGTGRVAIRIARAGYPVVGLDRSPAMLDVARSKSSEVENVRWIDVDMRSFEFDQVFGLVIIPGHSFQNLMTPADQIACLQSIKRHLHVDGRTLIHLDHQNVDWLGELTGVKGGVFEPAERFRHPVTGRDVMASRAWWYERSTQTAIVQTRWEELDEGGEVVNRVDSGKVPIHCVFPFELEHMINCAGLVIERLDGDFEKNEFSDDSEEIICVARSKGDLRSADGAGALGA